MTIFNHLLHFINQVKHPQNSASQPCCHASLQKQRKITPFPAIKTESAHDCLAIHDSLRLIHPTSPKHSHNREVKHYTERERPRNHRALKVRFSSSSLFRTLDTYAPRTRARRGLNIIELYRSEWKENSSRRYAATVDDDDDDEQRYTRAR